MATQISKAEALKAFKTLPMVQTARRVKVKDENGVEREKFETRDTSMALGHITGAARYEDRIVVTTIDGKKHEVGVAAAAAKE